MLSGGQIQRANQWSAISSLAHDHDLTDWLHEAYSELKSEKAAEEAAEAISEAPYQLRDFFEYGTGGTEAVDAFGEYMDEGERETEAYDESTTLLDKLEAELRQRLNLEPSDW